MAKDYRQRIYQSYMTSSAHHYQQMTDAAVYEQLRLFYRKIYLPWLPADRQAPILDVGCGAGHFLYFLQQEGYNRAEGIDQSAEMLKQCQNQGLKNTQLTDWAEFLSSCPEAYAAIITNDFLEHLTAEEVLHFLDLCLASLEPGGRLIQKLPNAYTIFAGRDRYIDFTHQLSFTPQSALQVLTTVGFTQVRILPVYAPIRGLKSALRNVVWKIVFLPVVRACSYMFDGERQPAIYTINQLTVAEKPYFGHTRVWN
jgi:2-polyprenyl-3-methyl-5-hydroxy-6-metoxy-1,4-benzoquinol methylase